jgi:hypothetical protein
VNPIQAVRETTAQGLYDPYSGNTGRLMLCGSGAPGGATRSKALGGTFVDGSDSYPSIFSNGVFFA